MRKFGTHSVNLSTRMASRAFEYDFLGYSKQLRWSLPTDLRHGFEAMIWK